MKNTTILGTDPSTIYSYDADNNLTNVSDSGLTNSWTYDAYDRVSSYKDPYGNLIQYQYDANGNMTNLIYPGGRNVFYAYDGNNHLTNVTDWAGRQTTLTYDLDGHLTTIIRPNGTQRIIGYDSAGEETNIVEQTASNTPIALCRFNWNPSTTMQWEFLAPLPQNANLPTRTMTYDADNELKTVDGNNVSLDLDGNLVSGPLTNDTFATYAYDARNRLLNVGGVTNIYDGMNNRIGQTQGTNVMIYVINPNAKLPQMLVRIKNGITNYYVYDGGAGLIYQTTETATSTNTQTYHYDYRGSTIALTGDSGQVTDRMGYSLYATLTSHVGTNDTPFLFNGRYGVQTDPNGMLYMRARYYSPFLCRFLNPDPTGFSGGMNFYAYANGNPVSNEDPFGLWVGADDLLFTMGGALLGAVSQSLADIVSGNGTGWSGIGRAAAAGAAGGEATLYGTPIAGGAVFAATKNTLDQSAEMAAIGNSFNFTELGVQTGVGVATSYGAEFIPVPVIQGLNAGQGSFDAVTAQMLTKLDNGTIQNISGNTAGQMLVSQIYAGLPDTLVDGSVDGVENILFGNSDNASSSAGQSPVDWLGNPILSSSTGKPPSH